MSRHLHTHDHQTTRITLAATVYLMTNAVLFGIGAIAVLSIPALQEKASLLLPLVVTISIIAAAPVSWIIAPRLRARTWRGRNGDLISGPIRIDDYREQTRIY